MNDAMNRYYDMLLCARSLEELNKIGVEMYHDDSICLDDYNHLLDLYFKLRDGFDLIEVASSIVISNVRER